MAGNSLRIDTARLRNDGGLEFLFKEGDAPLPLELSNDGVIFPGGRQQFIEELRDFATLIKENPKYKLFMLLAQQIKDDPTIRQSTINAMNGRSITVDFSAPAKVITV